MDKCNKSDEHEEHSNNHSFDRNLQIFTSSSNANFEQFFNNANLICDVLKIDEPWMKMDEMQKKFNSISEEIDKCNYTIMDNETCIQNMRKQIGELNQDLASSQLILKEIEVFVDAFANEKSNFQSNLLKKHNAFKTSFRLYKTCLDIYVSVESENQILSCIICFFTQKFHDEYSVGFRKNVNEDKWKLFSIKPNIPESQLKEIQQPFSTINDICNFVSTIRKIFKRLKITL